jgi:hypothetical protein
MQSRGLCATGAIAVALGIVGACAGNDSPSAGPGDAGGTTDGPTSVGTPPNDGGGGTSDADAGDGGDGGPTSRPVVGYTVLGEVNYAFTQPYALAVDSTDHLYVSQRTDAADTHTLYLSTRNYGVDIAPGQARILQFDAAGSYLGWIGAGSDATFGFHAPTSTATAVYAFAPGAFNMIRGMTFGDDGHLFVLDDWRIQELDTSFNAVRWTGHGPGGTGGFGWRTGGGSDTYAGPGIGGFKWPSCIRIHKGRFWVGNWYWYDTPDGFDPDGQYDAIDLLDMSTGLGVGWLGGAFNPASAGTSTGLFDGGADAGTGLRPMASIVHSSSAGGIFSTPRHFVWQGDKIYVVDDTSDPVLSVFDENGVMQPGVLRHLVGTDEKPFAIAVDKYGNIIVSDMYTGSVRFFTTKLDANGEFTQAAEWQVDVASVENVRYPIISDFAWDSQDNLYVAASTKNKVYKIKLTY